MTEAQIGDVIWVAQLVGVVFWILIIGAGMSELFVWLGVKWRRWCWKRERQAKVRNLMRATPAPFKR